ncbi:ACD_00350 [African swine fever virus]
MLKSLLTLILCGVLLTLSILWLTTYHVELIEAIDDFYD